jgi:hypothetical protein
MTYVTTGARLAAARRPPLIAESAFLTSFMALIGAPERSSADVIARFSSNVRPGAGRLSSEEAPPEISAMTRSSGPAFLTRSNILCAACTPAASGTGWEASTTSIDRVLAE